jgi:hypothetical protein
MIQLFILGQILGYQAPDNRSALSGVDKVACLGVII